ncbi:MAG TPA: polysaccharide biosynthesis/export family protein [Bacteroidia bacterium]|jgi:polysaccharide export outer membrane protein|nr:polysaccharide biosynthesis/export family protein [Bacteroidia bacterium]
MLKTKKDYKYAQPPDSTNAADYRISPNDIIEFNLYSNDGFKLVDLTTLNGTNPNAFRIQNSIDYLVEPNGQVKLPVLGKIQISGYTLRDAQSVLEEKYSAFYIRPYVVLKIINKRVIVFPGSAGDAKVIPLVNNNTTLIEGIALAGGLADDGKAKMIKLIRVNKNKEREVYLLDLSVIEGIKQASMVLQANDIIYVEPRRRYAVRFLHEVAPIISVITSAFILYSYSRIITN